MEVAEYLASNYRPDVDFVDGTLVDRNWGDLQHGWLHCNIGAWLLMRAGRYRIRPVTSIRLRINPQRIRVADVAVLQEDAPSDPVVVRAPLLCVEILSPSDTLPGIWNRIDDYLQMGVPVCWIVDPATGIGWTATYSGWTKATNSILRAGEIEMPLSEVIE